MPTSPSSIPSTSLVQENPFFPPPSSLSSLTPALHSGLIPLSLLSLLSLLSTLTLLLFILVQCLHWRRQHRNSSTSTFAFAQTNQYVVLVANLLLADLQQAAAFAVSLHWLRVDGILAPTGACFAQGWLLHSGDVGSGVFVLAIGGHTLYTAVTGRRVGGRWFAGGVLGLWGMTYALTGIGVGLHGTKYFVRAGAWCWVSIEFENERLWLHYFWIFLAQGGTLVMYLVTFVVLRRRSRSLKGRRWVAVRAMDRVALLMTLYPLVYLLLTLPVSAGRMWSWAHGGKRFGTGYACATGSLLASCGWVDSLLYTLTRKRLISDAMHSDVSRRSSGTATRSSKVKDGGNGTEFVGVAECCGGDPTNPDCNSYPDILETPAFRSDSKTAPP